MYNIGIFKIFIPCRHHASSFYNITGRLIFVSSFDNTDEEFEMQENEQYF